MRLYLKLTQNTKLIPFNYQELLTGVIHKWLGENNEYHGKTAQYSFSWLQNTKATKQGINLTSSSYFFISSYKPEIIKQILKGVLNDPEMFSGVSVYDATIVEAPQFEKQHKFTLASPVLLKRREDGKHLTFEDEEFNQALTDNFKMKLSKAEINPEGFQIEVDKNYGFGKTKLITYKGVDNRTSLVPVLIQGNQEQISYAWSVGLGHSTGIGFGALK